MDHGVATVAVHLRLTGRQRALEALPGALCSVWFFVLGSIEDPHLLVAGFGLSGLEAMLLWRSASVGVDLTPTHLVVRRLRTVTIPWAAIVGVDEVRPGVGRGLQVRTRDRRWVLPAPKSGWGRSPVFGQARDEVVRFWVTAAGPSGPPDVVPLLPRRRRRPMETLQLIVTAILVAYAASLLSIGLLVAVIDPRPAVLLFLVTPAMAGLVCCALYPLRPRIAARWRRRAER